MGRAAPDTTTIAFNAPSGEKRALRALASELGTSYGELVRTLYLEAMHARHKSTAEAIAKIRAEHEHAVSERIAAGVAKRGGNIRAAHAANTIKPISSDGPPGLWEAAAQGGAAHELNEDRKRPSPVPSPSPQVSYRSKKARRPKRGKL